MHLKPKRAWQWVALVFAALALLLSLVLVVEHFRGRAAWRKYEKRMRAQGEKFTIAELQPPPVPADQNGAPLLQNAFFPVLGIAPQQLPPAMRYATSGVAIPVVKVHAWSSTVSGDVLLATNSSGTNSPAPRRGGPGGLGPGSSRNSQPRYIFTDEMLATNIAAQSAALAQVHTALSLGPLDYQLDYSLGFNLKIFHLAAQKTAVQWLRAASLSAAQQRNLPAALTNLIAQARLSHATTNELMIISQLVRIAVHQISVTAVWEALQADGWSEDQLRALQAALAPSDFVSSMGRALEVERAMNMKLMDEAMANPRSTLDVLLFDYGASGSGSAQPDLDEVIRPLRELFLTHVYLPVWNFAWKDADKLRVAQTWQGSIDLGRKQSSEPDWQLHTANREAIPEPGIEEGNGRRDGTWLNRIRFPFSQANRGWEGRALDRALTAETSRELVVTILALERFRLGRGGYPESLDELVPALRPSKPVDPFDGQPLRYRRLGNGRFLLYSIGSDFRDDGGDDRRTMSRDKPQFLMGRDIVWPRAATAEELQKVIEEESRSWR